MSTYVLIHGAWFGSWCWENVVPLLEREGHTVLAPDLPGYGGDTTPLTDITLPSYAERVCQVLDAQAEPVILVGHSWGGIAITQAAEYRPDKIATLIYLCAFLRRWSHWTLDMRPSTRRWRTWRCTWARCRRRRELRRRDAGRHTTNGYSPCTRGDDVHSARSGPRAPSDFQWRTLALPIKPAPPCPTDETEFRLVRDAEKLPYPMTCILSSLGDA